MSSNADFGDHPAKTHRRRIAMLLALLLAVFRPATGGAAGLDLTPYRGKVVYLDFWASWCGPCRQSFPWLDGLVSEYGSKNLVIIGVNVDKDRDRASRFLAVTPADIPIVYDPKGELAAMYNVTGMPSGVLIDVTGRVRFRHAGFSEKQKGLYEEQLQKLLAETIR